MIMIKSVSSEQVYKIINKPKNVPIIFWILVILAVVFNISNISAQTDKYNFKGNKIVIPVPKGFVEVSDILPDLYNYVESNEGKGITTLGLYIIKDFVYNNSDPDAFIPYYIKVSVQDKKLSSKEFKNYKKSFLRYLQRVLTLKIIKVLKQEMIISRTMEKLRVCKMAS